MRDPDSNRGASGYEPDGIDLFPIPQQRQPVFNHGETITGCLVMIYGEPEKNRNAS